MTMYPPPPESPPQHYGGGGSGPRAGFWRRLAGLLIDFIILLILAVIVGSILGTVAKSVGDNGARAIGYLIGPVYATVMIGSSRGQTIGQMAMGIRVIDFNTGGPIGYGRAFIRWLVSIVSGLVILIGYLWMLWDSEKQCWHDKAANDVVVPVSYYPINN